MKRFRMSKIRWLQLAIILFIGVNFLLVATDDEGKVDRVSYVNKWSESVTTDMKEELIKPAVLVPASELPIYFDDNQGAFEEFLVDEGELVIAGQDLFTYKVTNYYEAEAKLLSDISQVESEISAIEQAIAEIAAYPIMENYTMPPVLEEESIFIEIPQSSLEAEFMKEQFLTEKNQELAAKEGIITALQSQLSSLQTTEDTVTYTAPYSGRVSAISTTLDAPLLVLESVELEAYGELTEEERIKVEEGMLAELEMTEIDATLEGTVDSLAHTPERLAVHGPSVYPFSIMLHEEDVEDVDVNADDDLAADFILEDDDFTFEQELEEDLIDDYIDNSVIDEETSDLLPGYHGTLAIILEERFDVTAVEETALFGDIVWEMNVDGLLVKQTVETGLEEDGQMEVLDSLTPNDVLAEAPIREFRNQAYYITPLQWSELSWQALNMKEQAWQKGFLSGLISR